MCVRVIYKKICAYLGLNPNTASYENIDVYYQQCLEKIDYPYLLNLDKNVNLTTLPDGMSLWVEALEEVRSAKGLPILGGNYSIASRFCEYFCVK